MSNPNNSKRKTITIYLDIEQIDKLTAIAKEEGKPRNKLLVEIINQAIRTKELYNEHAWLDRIKRLVTKPIQN